MKRRLSVALTALALCLGFVLTGNAAPAQAATTAGPSWPLGTTFWSAANSGQTFSAWNSTGCDKFVVDNQGARLVGYTPNGVQTVWEIPWLDSDPNRLAMFTDYVFYPYTNSGLVMYSGRGIAGNYIQGPSFTVPSKDPGLTLNLESDGNLVIRDSAKNALLSTNLPHCLLPALPVWTEGSRINIGAIWWNRPHCVAMWVDNYGMHLGDNSGHVLRDLLFQAPQATYHSYFSVVHQFYTDGWLAPGTYLREMQSWNTGTWWRNVMGGNQSGPGSQTAGKMVLQDDGNLVLLDGLGNVISSTNTVTSC